MTEETQEMLAGSTKKGCERAGTCQPTRLLSTKPHYHSQLPCSSGIHYFKHTDKIKKHFKQHAAWGPINQPMFVVSQLTPNDKIPDKISDYPDLTSRSGLSAFRLHLVKVAFFCWGFNFFFRLFSEVKVE